MLLVGTYEGHVLQYSLEGTAADDGTLTVCVQRADGHLSPPPPSFTSCPLVRSFVFLAFRLAVGLRFNVHSAEGRRASTSCTRGR